MTAPAVERVSYETDLAVFLDLMEHESETYWAQAECAAAMAVKYGRRTAATLAADTGLSAGYVRGCVFR